MDIKVSIIIPVYNVAPYLDACLSSSVNQTFRDIEIIVVNDGSTDESACIIKKYAEKDNRIKVITKENQGLVYARKSGLDVACGEYVFHLDGDDYLEITAIEELYDEAMKSGADYVVCNYYTIFNNSKRKANVINELNGVSNQELLIYIIRNQAWHIWGILIRKSLFDDIVLYPVSLGEDLFFNMQICLKVKNPRALDSCLYGYLIREGSITGQTEEIKNELKFDMIKSIFFLLNEYTYNQLVKEEVYLMFYPFLLHCMRHEIMGFESILYNYYWSNKEVKRVLWKKRKDFYLITSIFYIYPPIGRLLVKIGLHINSFRRKLVVLCRKMDKRKE